MIKQTADELADIGPDPDWRPESLRTPSPAWPPPPLRASILAAVVLAHWLVLAWWLPRLATPRHAIDDEVAIRVEFISDPSPVATQPEVEVQAVTQVLPPVQPTPTRKRPRIQSDTYLQALPSLPAEKSRLILGP